MAKIGEYKIKTPKFIIFTDKDGTLNLEDKQLNSIFNMITAMGGMVIPITGRTVGDIESDLIKRKIKVPEIIIGDNGANIYHTKSGEFLIQSVLEHDNISAVIEHFIEQGGNKDYIRYTNGKNIFASNTKEVKEYYKSSKMAIFNKDILKELSEARKVTKITLAGTKQQMQESAEFLQNLELWSDMNSTKFPKREYQNYILDISQRNVNKGEAVKAIVSDLKPQFGYMCVGNGYNDISMFQVAINDGMIVGVMENSPQELIEEIKQYSLNKDKGKMMVIPFDKNLANKYLLRMAKLFQSYMRTQQRRTKRLPNLPRVDGKKIVHKKSETRDNYIKNKGNR